MELKFKVRIYLDKIFRILECVNGVLQYDFCSHLLKHVCYICTVVARSIQNLDKVKNIIKR